MTGPPRHLLSLADLSTTALGTLVDRGAALGSGRARPAPVLDGLVVGVLFLKPSTRTRTAFSAAALRLGADVLAYGPDDLQLTTGETVEDTGRVFGSMLDGLVARTAGPPEQLRTLARHCPGVVNAMSADEHPTQALADLATMLVVLGRLDGLRVLYLGEGNNTTSALALALPRFAGTLLDIRTPAGYGLSEQTLAVARGLAAPDAVVRQRHDLDDLPDDVDIVYTTQWQTTGTRKSDPRWRDDFVPLRVSAELMRSLPGARFMHDLPAHRGEEVDGAVLDGPASIAFQQARMKQHGATAVLEWCLGGRRTVRGAGPDDRATERPDGCLAGGTAPPDG